LRIRRRAIGALLALACLLIHSAPARSEDKVLIQGLFEAEVWKTDDASRLLSRNEGETAPAGRLRLWAVGEFLPRLQGFAVGRVEEGRGSYEDAGESVLDLAVVRYTFEAPRRLVIEGGKIVSPVGNFSRRYLSSTNPLIGSPDSYSVSYPYGIQVSGQVARLDYRVAAIDHPIVNDDYVPPDPGSAVRPAVALGVTPVTGLRFGVYATRGPYLGPGVEAVLPAGTKWKDYGQMITGTEVQFSRGHFELNGDFAVSSYEAPTKTFKSRGRAYFIEPKFTFSPRFFAALRVEKNDYPYIMPFGSFWVANNSELFDVEAGAGYRLAAGAVLKVAYRRDFWNVPDSRKSMFPNGHSVAAQLTYSFNVNSWLERPR
jgi:hypothetical protein